MSYSGERFTGRDVAEALAAAREKYGKTRREIGYRLVSDVKVGLVEESDEGDVVTIEAWPLRPEDVPPPPSHDEGGRFERRGRRDRGGGRGERRERSGPRDRGRDRDARPREQDEEPFDMPALLPAEGEESSQTDVVRTMLSGIVAGLGLGLEVGEVSESDAGISAALSGDDQGALLEEDGAGLESMQFLVNRMLHRHDKGFPRVSIDAGGHRERAREELVAKARELADEVLATGETRKLPPMGPFERRLVHVELAEREGLKTYSEGQGNHRRIAIAPKKSGDES